MLWSMVDIELIVTQWDVNADVVINNSIKVGINSYIVGCKLYIRYSLNVRGYIELIVTQWDVNGVGYGIVFIRTRINSYIVGCKW